MDRKQTMRVSEYLPLSVYCHRMPFKRYAPLESDNDLPHGFETSQRGPCSASARWRIPLLRPQSVHLPAYFRSANNGVHLKTHRQSCRTHEVDTPTRS